MVGQTALLEKAQPWLSGYPISFSGTSKSPFLFAGHMNLDQMGNNPYDEEKEEGTMNLSRRRFMRNIGLGAAGLGLASKKSGLASAPVKEIPKNSLLKIPIIRPRLRSASTAFP
jgi:hypothetical protein